MSQDTINQEGMTFEEWVCAAGVAVFDQEFVKPYTSSYQYAVEHSPEHYKRGGCFTDRRAVKRHTTRWYLERVRAAWKAGEDPTEWRAHER